MDLIGGFLAERCIQASIASVSADSLYRAYSEWCEENGERAITQRRLGMTLTERGFDRRKSGAAKRWHWFGVGLLKGDTDPTDPSDPDSGINAHARAYAGGTGTKGPMGPLGPSAERLPYRDAS